MKLLITGNTPQQCGRGTQLKYGAVIDLFAAALRDAGVEIDHRILNPDENLDEYDAVWIGQTPINSMSSRYMFGPLEAYGRCVEQGKPVVFYIDDWQTQLLNSAYKSILKEPARLVRVPGSKLHDSRHQIDWAREPGNIDKVMKGVDLLFNSPWPTVVAPFYTWGDHMEIFKKMPQISAENLVAVDPSRYVEWYPLVPVPDSERVPQWVLGILSDQLGWITELGLTLEPPTPEEVEALSIGDVGAIEGWRWPLFHIGGKASKAKIRMKERELVQLYAESWGVLSPPYWHAGSGWWRNRFVYTAYAGAILAGGPQEGAPCGPEYTYPVEMIERFSGSQLRQLADAQKSRLLSQMSTKEEVQTKLLEVFEKAIANAD